MTPEELEAWRLAYVASVEDGSLRAELDAKAAAKGGPPATDREWETALVVSGYGPLPTDMRAKPRPKTHQP
jgi:hypothetical protein